MGDKIGVSQLKGYSHPLFDESLEYDQIQCFLGQNDDR